MKDKLTMLMILDGFGDNKNKDGNAIQLAKTPNIDRLMKKYPNTDIFTSGLHVGLPEGQMGNSEVGHTNIGAGRIVYQELTRITKSIEDGDFFSNAELIGASKAHILFREILPNCLSPIFTKMALDVGWVILMGASLSFVGLGEQPPTPAFGQMISDGAALMPDIWWLTIFPAAGIAFMILGFNFLGDGIRDMFDKGGH